MMPIEPALPDAIHAVAGESQPEYTPVPIACINHHSYIYTNESYNTVVMAFALTDDERRAIAEGADVYVGLLTFGAPQQPIIVAVGPEVFQCL